MLRVFFYNIDSRLSPSKVIMRNPSLLLVSFILAKPSLEFIVLMIYDYFDSETDESVLIFFMTSILEVEVLKTL